MGKRKNEAEKEEIKIIKQSERRDSKKEKKISKALYVTKLALQLAIQSEHGRTRVRPYIWA